MSRRPGRVGDLIRAQLAQIILREVRDPRVQLTTVSSVDVTADLRHAHVKVSVLGNDEERDAALEALEHARGFLRSRLAKGELRHLRVTPELRFELDRGPEHSQRISDLLETLDDSDQRT